MLDVAVYEHPARIAKTKRAIGAAMRYLRTTGMTCRLVRFPGYGSPVPFVPSRAAVVYGAGTPQGEPHHAYNLELRRLMRESGLGVVVVVLEMGFIDRGRHFSVGLGDIAGFGDYAMNIPVPRRPARIPVRTLPRRRPGPGGCVLFCAQCPGDAQIRVPDYGAFVTDTLREIRRRTSRPLVFRAHPRMDPALHPDWSDPARMESEFGAELSSGGPIEGDFARAHCVVSYNSNSLLDALVAGLPVFCFAPCVAGPCANWGLGALEDPRFPGPGELGALVSDATWSQWTAGEIAAGAPLQFLKGALGEGARRAAA